MEIKITKNGNNLGTIGWLAKRIETKEVSFSEGSLKGNGHHGLWLNGPKGLSQFLGAFNQYDSNSYEDPRYEVAFMPGDREPIWTDAAWTVLIEIAQAWCDDCNEYIENETPVEFKILRVEKEGAI